jgi:putative ABC transport system permease protein
LTRIVKEGAVIGITGIAAGATGGIVLARIVSHYIIEIEIPGVIPIVGAALVLVGAAILASLMPGARASRVDVIGALRAD